jgi:3-dehydroquinate synthase
MTVPTPHRIDLPGSRVLVGPGLLEQAGEWVASLAAAHAYAVITDSNVAPSWLEPLVRSLERAGDTRVLTREMPAGEQYKTRESWSALSDWMLSEGCGRDTTVVALGGGVIGDLAGFVAATYLRGVPVAQVPTTLLAMVDASIGGKTGVDTPAGKNLVGAFHQPAVVLADPEVLSTLPARELRAGFAEVIKHGAISNAEIFEDAVRFASVVHERNGVGRTTDWRDAAAAALIARSASIKADIVRRDPREAGVRQTLNAGHTVAHALELASGYALAHGEAVSIGLVTESAAGERAGVTAPGTSARLTSALVHAGLPTAIPAGLDADSLVGAMRTDKKNRRGRLRFALLSEVGRMAGNETAGWTTALEESLVREVLAAAAAGAPAPNEAGAGAPARR